MLRLFELSSGRADPFDVEQWHRIAHYGIGARRRAVVVAQTNRTIHWRRAATQRKGRARYPVPKKCEGETYYSYSQE